MIILRKLDASSYNPTIKGTDSIVLGATSHTVTFTTNQTNTNYNLSVDLITSDANPSVYSYVTSNKTVSGFTVFFSGEIDSNAFVLEWQVFIDASSSNRGTDSIVLGATSHTVTFTTNQTNTNYNLSVDLITSDANPSVYSYVTSNKTVSGFTVFFSGEIDSNAFVLEWQVFI